MPITKRPTPKLADQAKAPDDAAVAAFINGAPDAKDVKTETAPEPQSGISTMRGKQAQISLALPPGLLAQIDQAAEHLAISRAAFIKQALVRAVHAEGK